MAASEKQPESPTPLTGRRESLAALFDIHRSRTSKSDFAKIELCLTDEERGKAKYQYLDGTHCIRRLDETEKDQLKHEFIDEGNMELIAEGHYFLTLALEDANGGKDVDAAEKILDALYDASLEDLACVEEVVDDATRLPLDALFGVQLSTVDSGQEDDAHPSIDLN